MAIETSCDETAAAVIGVENDRPVVLSNIISSSADLHAKTGGIVPEVASRAHMEAMMPVVEEALDQAKLKIENITHIAATNGPGLIGSLLVGFNAAKTIAYARDLPFIPINHIEGHIYSAFSRESNISNLKSKIFPILALTVSGGHTSLTMMKDHGKYETIGETIDDAAGEAFDKVAKLLGLGYPGGPIVSKFASKFRDKASSYQLSAISFPRPLLNKPNFDFSFSGLKTAVLTQVLKLKAKSSKLTASQKQEICFAFEEAAVDVLTTKTVRAARKYKPRAVILAGGVAANKRLREALSYQLSAAGFKLFVPPIELCGDNAAMIGLAAYYHIVKNNIPELFSTTVDSNTAL